MSFVAISKGSVQKNYTNSWRNEDDTRISKSSLTTETVSYTHLDVYKRQGINIVLTRVKCLTRLSIHRPKINVFIKCIYKDY